jgi:hypothetical protein
MKDTNMADLLANGTRQQLMDYCVWNDANGIWTDEQCEFEGYEPATIEDLRAMIRYWIDEA